MHRPSTYMRVKVVFRFVIFPIVVHLMSFLLSVGFVFTFYTKPLKK